MGSVPVWIMGHLATRVNVWRDPLAEELGLPGMLLGLTRRGK